MVRKGLRILWERITKQGLQPTLLWAIDHGVRILAGANIRALSEVTPTLHVGGQYRRRGWRRLAQRGITAVVDMRVEYDDRAAGIAPPRYLYVPTADDAAPTLDQLREGVAFIAAEVARGGSVYVHCGAGVGRAATMAVAYLIYTGLSPEQAWAQVRQVRPFIRPTAAQVAQIERYAGQV
ncbi:MAG: dual specificity protein phosphatase family protein [Anaerolineae bacterium]|nr:dual specificity protein phosphatase family protein [Anaerolineae bacterium]